MKLLATITLANSIIVFVAADLSKVELHQRALNVLNTNSKPHAFGRDLVSDKCHSNQEELEKTGINEGLIEINVDDICEDEFSHSTITEECNYSNVIIDGDKCTSAGGRVIKYDVEMHCDGLSYHAYEVTVCLHTTCDSSEFIAYAENTLEEEKTCDYAFSITHDPDTETRIATSSPPTCTSHLNEHHCYQAGCVWFRDIRNDFDICLGCENIPNEKICDRKGCLWSDEECSNASAIELQQLLILKRNLMSFLTSTLVIVVIGLLFSIQACKPMQLQTSYIISEG